MSRMACGLSVALLVLAAGCMESLEKQAAKSPNSIVGKTTQNIGEFDPNAGAKVSDAKVEITNPITGPLEAYGPMVERISQLKVKPAIDLFHATEGRYPATYEEFMELIVKPNNIQLPVLPGGKQYQYDVANHALVVIDAPAK